ncbi:exosortase A system-associated hydrolase 1 [Sphingomonas guangdongensis]|uniref:Exosortase A system-associated hydrolase 1 n=1 Tax=Sphingomonas guangdongensis TaxID=1141890 RepID=A0A285R5H8_9SPHN|nr:hydrolase 1, exosortase A system-associated [Sphingomonas guangdongensis]SOB87597.1 exosortase A system-associated hydrolase 1 [Sphingomonas guangdongensis]
MRRVLEITCESDTIVATLDEAASSTGLLIVSGGNEIRAGAHRGMALLAADLAAQGVPVLRYDRRGIGDSTGENRGFEESAADIAAAAAALRATGVTRVVAFGNCDAASALALFHAAAGLDALVLANPWTGNSGSGDLPQAAAIRARYAERLRDPREWLRLLGGGVNLRKLAGGLLKVVKPTSAEGLVERMADALRASGIPATFLLATRDNTAVAFRAAWKAGSPGKIVELTSSSHSFAGAADKTWLGERLLEAVKLPFL